MDPLWTDNPSDPCVYCVNWIDDPDAEDWEQKMIPLLAPGVVASQLYRTPHTQCQQMVTEYELYHKGEMV